MSFIATLEKHRDESPSNQTEQQKTKEFVASTEIWQVAIQMGGCHAPVKRNKAVPVR
jgi:fructose/tagatose bisphosphate aldolase